MVTTTVEAGNEVATIVTALGHTSELCQLAIRLARIASWCLHRSHNGSYSKAEPVGDIVNVRSGPSGGNMARTEKDKMLAGELYDASAPDIQAELAATHRWLARYNAALDMAASDRHALLLERLAAVGDGAVIRPPFHCDYGFNIRLGAGAFVNFNCVILDVVEVTIGDRTQIGPGVQILAADHPRDPALRASGLEFGRPIRIGRNVWIGAGAIILPGVSIDDDALVGAGSVVTRDVPARATAVGNPARVRPDAASG
jgi:maltose O-acetyltransferase